jgi:excisionase family DNA binding protein
MLSNIEMKSTLTTAEAARLLHVHTNTLRRWNDRGLIPANRIGPRGDRRFGREDIARFIAEFTIRKGQLRAK